MTAIGRSIATMAAALAVVTPVVAAPAHAHHGYAGPVRLYVERVGVEPRADGWTVRAAVNDTGSGKPAPGFLVNATGSGPEGATFGPITLGDPDADGRYEAGLGPLAAGDWSLTVDVGDAPGGEERAIPIRRTMTATVQPGHGLEILARAPAADDPAPSGSVPLLPLALSLAVLALVGLLVRRELSNRGYKRKPRRGSVESC